MAQWGDICGEIKKVNDKNMKQDRNQQLYRNVKNYYNLAKKQIIEEGFVK